MAGTTAKQGQLSRTTCVLFEHCRYSVQANFSRRYDLRRHTSSTLHLSVKCWCFSMFLCTINRGQLTAQWSSPDENVETHCSGGPQETPKSISPCPVSQKGGEMQVGLHVQFVWLVNPVDVAERTHLMEGKCIFTGITPHTVTSPPALPCRLDRRRWWYRCSLLANCCHVARVSARVGGV